MNYHLFVCNQNVSFFFQKSNIYLRKNLLILSIYDILVSLYSVYNTSGANERIFIK
jgi:hypothetical protein